MPECSVNQTYRFMYKQHVTSLAPYIFIRLSDIEDKHYIQTCPFKVHFTFWVFHFHVKGPEVTDNPKGLQPMKCVFIPLPLRSL